MTRTHRPPPMRRGQPPPAGKPAVGEFDADEPARPSAIDSGGGGDAGLRRLVRAQLLAVVCEVLLPLLVFYLLRALGVSQWWALMAAVLAAAPYAVATLWRSRRIDPVALVTLSVLVLSVMLGALSTDPRTLAVRDGWTAALGGLFGLWMLISVAAGTPAQLTLGRTIAEIKRGHDGADAWAARWHTDAHFRRGLRIDTAAWGAVMLASAVLHIALAYTLPIDLIPLITTAAWYAGLAALIAWHAWYVRREHLDA